MPQEARCFVERLAFCTTLGYGETPGDRARLGVPSGGPRKIFTDLADWRFDAAKRLQLESVHPGVDADWLRASVGFEMMIPSDLPQTAPPSADELRLIREVIDPRSLFLESRIA